MPRRSARFIGRSEHLATLEAALDRARARSAAVVLVAGEAGIGKSRLLAEFTAGAAAGGALVLRGDCVPLAGAGVPFGAVAALLRDAARQVPELAGFVAGQAADAGHLLPGVVADVPPLIGELAQLRLLESIRAVLAFLATETPVVAVVEDLHWADRSSADALTYLAASLGASGVLLVVSFRPDELPRADPLHPALAQLARAAHTDRLDLAPFTAAELAQQARDLLGEEPVAGLLEELAMRSGGNPFFVEELIAARHRGRPAGVPSALSDLLMGVLDPLAGPVRHMLNVAAAIGREVPVDLLASALATEAVELVDRLRTAVDAGVLVPLGSDLAFRHELLRETVLGTLLPGERAAVHLTVARAMSDDPSLAPGGRAWSNLAMHWQLAGEPRRALAAAATACREARGLGALAEAARHGSHALELWDAVPDAEQVTGLDRIDLLLQLAEDSLLGGGTPAHTWTRHALDLLDRTGDPVRHAIVTARLARYELMAGHDIRRVLDTAARATAEAAALTDLRAQALVALDHAQILLHCDSYDMSRDHAAAALQRAVELGDRVIEVHARAVLAVDSCSVGDWQVSMSEFDLAERLSEQLAGPGAGEARARAALSHAVCLLWLGFPERAFDRAAAGVKRSSADGLDLSLGAALRATAAAAAVTSGRVDTAERLLDEIPRPALQRYAQFRIEARQMLDLARGTLDTVSVYQGTSYDQQAPIWLHPTGSAEAALALGQPARARDEVARLLSVAVERGMTLEVPRLVAMGIAAESQAADNARAGRDSGVVAGCRRRAAQLIEVGERTAAAVCERAATLPPDAIVWRAIGEGWAARLEGRPEYEAWDRAVATSEAAGMPLLGVQARIEAARCRLRTGDRAAAAEILGVALATATRCGAHGLAAAASRLIERARLGTATTERLDGRTTGERLGLTAREIQVLRLVADGRTNREIGEALYMSAKTASVHVTALLRKLEVPGRRDAARRARQLGLA